jgi:hypothetical protein
MKRTANVIVIAALLLATDGCGVVNQVQQAGNLVNCDFRIATVTNLTLAGVNIQGAGALHDLNFGDVAQIMTAVTGATFPLSFTLNLEGKNPNPSPAGLNRLDWILFIDDIQMTQGILDQPFTIPANGTAMIPVGMTVDLKKVLTGRSADAIVNFAFNLAGESNRPTRLMIKVKPTIMIGHTPLTYPGYINIKTEFSGIQ